MSRRDEVSGGDDFKAVVNLAGAGEGAFDIRLDVFLADVFGEFGLLENLAGLGASAAEQESTAGFAQTIGEDFDGVEAGGVDGGHVAEAEDDYRGELVDMVGGIDEFIGG